MRRFPTRSIHVALPVLALTLAAETAYAGGGPMNVLVLYSQDDAAATEVAKLYETERDLPPGHLCPLAGLTPDMKQIDVPTFQTKIQAPFDACLAALPQPDEIDYVVLVRGLPYVVTLSEYTASLEALIQVGHAKSMTTGMDIAGAGQPDMAASVPNPLFNQGLFWNDADSPIKNQYAAWYASAAGIIKAKEQPRSFRRKDIKPKGTYDFSGQLFVVQSLDGFDYEDAKALVMRAKASDGSFPMDELLCMHGEDEARGARDPECELATRMLKNAGMNATFLDPFDGGLSGHKLMAYFTGSADTVKNAIAGNTFAPGAIAENLTSLGAVPGNFFCSPDGKQCPAGEAQTSIARFIRAGATGAHGAVNEPFNNIFPNAGTLLFYTFGYNMGESFLYNQRFLYWQNLHIGDPLATPYAKRPTVEIVANTEGVTVTAEHEAGIAHIDLFVAGKRVSQNDGAGELTIAMPGKAGDTLDLLAVAIANNAKVMRAGWPQEEQFPQPDVQGWKAAKIVLQEPAAGAGGGGEGGSGSGSASTGAGGGDNDGSDDEGCGCRLASFGASDNDDNNGPAAFGLGLAALATLRRRRRTTDH